MEDDGIVVPVDNQGSEHKGLYTQSETQTETSYNWWNVAVVSSLSDQTEGSL